MVLSFLHEGFILVRSKEACVAVLLHQCIDVVHRWLEDVAAGIEVTGWFLQSLSNNLHGLTVNVHLMCGTSLQVTPFYVCFPFLNFRVWTQYEFFACFVEVYILLAVFFF